MKELTLATYRHYSKDELETEAIQAAIDECAAAGGGRVTFLPGIYHSGMIRLRSGVHLHLQRGAIILGTANLEDYPMPESAFVDAVGQPRGRALILGENISDFSITGEGIIDGGGGCFRPTAPEHPQRPFLVRIVHSRNFEFHGVTFRNSAAWTIHLLDCQDATLERLSIDSRVNNNNDGIDIDSSRRVTVRHCEIFADDDAICLKSTRREPCEDILVHDCLLGTDCGALKLGTESYGDIRRVTMRDCRIVYAATGAIKIFTSDGAIFEDIKIANIDIERGTGPLAFRLGHRGRTYAKDDQPKGPGVLRRVHVSNVKARVFTPPVGTPNYFTMEMMPPEAFSGVLCTGVPGHNIEDLTIEDCEIEFVGGFQGDPATLTPPEQPAMYPEHYYFGALPGAAFFFRHARNVTLRRVKCRLAKADTRPSIATEDVENFVVENCAP